MGLNFPKLIIYKTGPIEYWCNEYIKRNNMNTVHIFGYLEKKEVEKLIANSKAFMLPIQYYEGVPMVIVKIYSVGRLIIGSVLGSAGRIMIKDTTEWKFNRKNPEEFAFLVRDTKAINFCNINPSVLN